MKRNVADNGLEIQPNKMQRVDVSNICVRFLIPARAAGLVIGKGGENIRKIRSQYTVKLNIPDSRGTERVFTIESDLQTVCNVMRDLCPKLKDVMNARLSDPKRIVGNQQGQWRRRGPAGDEHLEDDGMIDIRLLVHQSVAGSIIGRGGERIKDFRSRYKMRVIKVYQMLAPGSSDRVVQLVADPENAVRCLESVIEVVENTPIRGPSDLYDANNANEAQALSYGGWLSKEGQKAFSQGLPISGNMPGMPAPPQGTDMPPPRSMPGMGYGRGPRGLPPHVPAPGMYENGRIMGGPPQRAVGPRPNMVAGYEHGPYQMGGGYDSMPPANMYGPGNPVNQVGYDDGASGSYQGQIIGYEGMPPQNAGGYGGPVSHVPDMGRPAPGMQYKGSGMYGGPPVGYGGPEDGRMGQWW